MTPLDMEHGYSDSLLDMAHKRARENDKATLTDKKCDPQTPAHSPE